MCRWLAYKGPDLLMSHLLLDSDNSLVRQTISFDGFEPGEHSPRSPVEGDGCGIGWYDLSVRTQPARFVSTLPAWNNRNLENLAGIARTRLLFGHVRAASRHSPVLRVNCHPFKVGDLLFMHNGGVAEFSRIRRRLLAQLPDSLFDAVRGHTDSEHCFALLLSYLSTLEAPVPLVAMRDAIKRTIETVLGWVGELGVVDTSWLNFAITDGHSIVACRYATEHAPDQQLARSLYYSAAERFELDSEGNLQAVPAERPGAVVIASEPLTLAEPDQLGDWEVIPEGSLITISADFDIGLESF